MCCLIFVDWLIALKLYGLSIQILHSTAIAPVSAKRQWWSVTVLWAPMQLCFLTGETTKAYEKPSIPGTTIQPVTLTQAQATPVAEVTHRSTSKPFAASVTNSPRPQPVGHRSQEMGE